MGKTRDNGVIYYMDGYERCGGGRPVCVWRDEMAMAGEEARRRSRRGRGRREWERHGMAV